MEIEKLVKLALVNHDIDQEKIMNNVLKKRRRRMPVKKVIIHAELFETDSKNPSKLRDLIKNLKHAGDKQLTGILK